MSRKFRTLTPDEELALARRYKDHGDQNAADRLVTSHVPLVVRTAMGYRGYGLPVAELISEGNLGLIQAVRRFEPERGFRLATYAVWLIKAAIQEYILHSWSLVKLGTSAKQKRLFFNLGKLKRRIQALDDGDLNPDQAASIAAKLGVTAEDVVLMNRRLRGDASLNAPLRADGEGSGEWLDWLVDESPDQEEQLAAIEEANNRRRLLREAIGVLNERERRVLAARRLVEEPISLHELSSELGVSHQRVHQIEVRAFDKVQTAIRASIDALGHGAAPTARPESRAAAGNRTAGQAAAQERVLPDGTGNHHLGSTRPRDDGSRDKRPILRPRPIKIGRLLAAAGRQQFQL